LLGSYSPYLYALLRIIAGLLFTMHGSQKLLGFPGDKDPVQLFSSSENIHSAHKRIESEKTTGKIVIEVDEE
jgi:uncharacterized membrane protein YphA (DoxX/SURF4 family)